MITRKALVAKLQNMNLDSVLLAISARSYTNNGSREVAASQVLEKLTGLPVIGQSNHSTKRGKMASNPKWLTQLFTDITWSVGNITAGSVLQALS